MGDFIAEGHRTDISKGDGRKRELRTKRDEELSDWHAVRLVAVGLKGCFQRYSRPCRTFGQRLVGEMSNETTGLIYHDVIDRILVSEGGNVAAIFEPERSRIDPISTFHANLSISNSHNKGMSKKGILVLCLLALSSCVFAQKWCFVVAGDGRSNGLDSKRPEDKDGINALITAEMRDAVLSEKAEALLWTGDLVYGSKEEAQFRSQMARWMEIMKPLWDAGVQVLPVRGNHEATCPQSVAVWNEFFQGKYALPQNGPWNAKNLSFFAVRHNALFVGVDQFITGPGTLPMPWLYGVLGQKRPMHVFTYGHEMAFMAGGHKDNLDRFPVDRDNYWKLLGTSGSRAFFAGHDHFYNDMSVSDPADPSFPVIRQYVAGTAGAPFYKSEPYSGNNSGWKLEEVKRFDNMYGYLLVEIDGNRATITFKGRVSPGKYEPQDVWSYSL